MGNSKIIETISKNKYNRNTFKKFVMQIFCNEYNEYNQQIEIPKNHKNLFKRCNILGKIENSKFEKILLVEVELLENILVDSSRTQQRNIISKILKDYSCDAALVSFYQKKNDEWRFSLITLEYKLVGNKVKIELTPAKRYSFLMGENSNKHHTLYKQLIKLTNTSEKLFLKDIIEIFKVETVTEQFFNDYKKKYFELKDILIKDMEFTKIFEDNQIPLNEYAEQFSKKLIGQIAFIYFMQKKGIIGLPIKHETEETYYKWGEGDKNFLMNLFENKSYDNFFNDLLEPLFYEALNKKRNYDIYKKLNCKIPFLNGGLFEPISNYNWKFTHINIPNSFFSNIEKKGFDSDGLLDIFNRYNFTVNEEEPLEKEVAVDPEMLGKVFENLLDIDKRKNKGAFYTPRNIVVYMSRELLIKHLVKELEIAEEELRLFFKYGDQLQSHDEKIKNLDSLKIPSVIFDNLVEIDECLRNIKIADPAVGSGAFLLGILNEIVNIRDLITYYLVKKINIDSNFNSTYKYNIHRDRNRYNLKIETIQNCLYAVDIDPSAIDITKLRLWLSLIMEQEISDNKIKPLPNLDTNIYVGNSLVDELNGKKLFDKKYLSKNKISNKKNNQLKFHYSNTQDILNDLIKTQNKYFYEHDHDLKLYIKEEIDFYREELIENELYNIGDYEAIEIYKKSKKERYKSFFIWELEFASVFRENGGFDILIGNPPYISERKGGNIFTNVRSTSFGKKYYIGKMDFWYFFTSKAIELLKDGGHFSFIAPNNWLTTAGGKKMREHIVNECNFLEFISFSDYEVFDTAKQQTMIFTLKKEKNNNSKVKTKFYKEDISIDDFLESTEFIESSIQVDNKTSNMYFINKEDEILLNKILDKSNTTLLNTEVRQGIVTPQDYVNKKSLSTLGDSYYLNQGIFVLSEKELKNLGELNIQEKKLIKPLFTSNEIKKYTIDPVNKYYIIYSGTEVNNNPSDYPNIISHLNKFNKVITSINKPYGLHRKRDESLFTTGGLIGYRKCTEPTFSMSKSECYVLQTFNIIKTDRINNYYLLALLNSRLIKYWLSNRGKMQGNQYQVDKEPLLNIPIYYDIKSKNIKNIINLCEKLVEYDNDKLLVDEIDTLIYELYELSKEDIVYIKNQTINK